MIHTISTGPKPAKKICGIDIKEKKKYTDFDLIR